MQTWTEDRGPQMASPKGRTILKFELVGDQPSISMPKYSDIIRVKTETDGRVWLWAVVDTRLGSVNYHFSKFDVPVLEEFEVFLSGADEILSLEHANGFTSMWISHGQSIEGPVEEPTRFRAFKTGAEMPDNITDDYLYVGFYPLFIQIELGLYVFKEIK